MLDVQQVEEEEEFIPASPKYDERSFFYTTPAAFRPAALAGRPQTQWATQGTFLSGAPAAAPGPGPAATASQGPVDSLPHAPHSQELHDGQQQQEAVQHHQQQQQQSSQEDVRQGVGGNSPSKKRPRPGQSHTQL